MMSTIATLITIAGALLLTLPPVAQATEPSERQTSAAEVRREINEALQAIGGYSAEQRDAALTKAKESLEKTDKQIEKLQQQMDQEWDAMNEATRTKARAALEELRQQRTNLAEWYGGLKHSSEAAWEEIKKGFAKSYRDLEDALVKAREEY